MNELGLNALNTIDARAFVTLNVLWKKYNSTPAATDPKEKRQLLMRFLSCFVQQFADEDVSLLDCSLGNTSTIAQELIWHLMDQLELLCSRSGEGSVVTPEDIYLFLCSTHGRLLLCGIEILTRQPKNTTVVPGLATIIVSLLSKLMTLPKEYVAAHHHEAFDAIGGSYCTFHPIGWFFSLPKSPSHFSFLYGNEGDQPTNLQDGESFTLRSSVTSLSGNIGLPVGTYPLEGSGPDSGEEEEVTFHSLFGSVTHHLLFVLDHLFGDGFALEELVEQNHLLRLLEILSTDCEIGETDLLLLQRQLVRCLARLLQTASLSFKHINIIHEMKVLPFILSTLKQTGLMQPTIALELCQLVVYMLKVSSAITPNIFSQFQDAEGYLIMADNLIYIGKYGTREEKLRIIGVITHLLFVDGNYDFADPEIIRNPESFRILLCGVHETTMDMKTDLLNTIAAIFGLGGIGAGYMTLQGQEPFKSMFLQFNSLSLLNQRIILNTMNAVMNATSLLTDELRCYCRLLSGTKPSTILVVSQHMRSLFSEENLSKDTMRAVGLINILTDYLVLPKDLICRNALVDMEELALSLSLITDLGLPSIDFPPDPLVEEEVGLGIGGKDKTSLWVLYAVSKSVLELLLVSLSSNPANQVQFRDAHGVKNLYTLLTDSELRRAALRIIAIMAVGDSLQEYKIIPDLVVVLQSSGGAATTEPDVLLMRIDILSTLCFIFQLNENSKTAFRTGGGFTWAMSVIDGIGRRIHQNPGDSHDYALYFLKALLNTFSKALTGNPQNQAYIKNDMQFLAATLRNWSILDGPHALDLCDDLLDICVHRTWPPSCDEHPLDPKRTGRISDHIVETSSSPSKVPPILSSKDRIDPPSTTRSTKEKETPIIKTSLPSTPSGYLGIYNEIPSFGFEVTSPSKIGLAFAPGELTFPDIESFQKLALSKSPGEIVATESYFSKIRTRLSSCPKCRDSIVVENPEIYTLILTLLGNSPTALANIGIIDPYSKDSAYYTIKDSADTTPNSSRSPVRSPARSPTSSGATSPREGNGSSISGVLNDPLLRSQVQSRAIVVILKKMIFLAGQDRAAQALCSSEIVLDIIQRFGNILKDPTHYLQSLLLRLIERIGTNHIALTELREYFRLLQDEKFPLNMLTTLVSISSQEVSPCFHVQLRNGDGEGYLESPQMIERIWPPPKGWTISMWFRVISFGSSSEKGNEITLFSFLTTPSKSKIEAKIIGKNVVFFSSSSKETLPFIDFTVEEGRWYHLILACIGHTKKDISHLKLYIDGLKVGQGMLTCPRPVLSSLSLRFGSNQAVPLPTSMASYSSWSLGNVWVFEEVPSESEAFLWYVVGPNHLGSLNVNLSRFEIPDMIREKTLALFHSNIQILLHPATVSLHYWQERNLFLFAAKSMVLAQPLRLNFLGAATGQVGASLSTSKMLQTSSMKIGEDVTGATRFAVRDAIHNIGGVTVVIYLIGLVSEREYQRESLKLLQRLLSFNARNVKEMEDIGGYELVSFMIKKNNWVVDEALLSTLCSFVGLSKAARSPTYSNGLIANVAPFRHFLLDWGIWKNAPLSVQRMVFESMVELVSTNEHSNFNVLQFRSIKVMRILFDMFRTEDGTLPLVLAPFFIQIIQSIIEDTNNGGNEDLQLIMQYLIATHPLKVQTNTCAIHRPRPDPSSASSLPGCSSNEDIAFKLGGSSSDSGSDLPIPGFSRPPRYPSIRIYVLHLLIELLSTSDQAIEKFSKICDLSALLALANHPSVETRIAIVKIIDLYLRLPDLAIAFEKMKGFALLAQTLKNYSVNEELVGVLFCILLGKPSYRFHAEHQGPAHSQNTSQNTSYPNLYAVSHQTTRQTWSIHSYFLGQVYTVLNRPSALYPILTLVGSCDIVVDLQHFILKTLHDGFLQSDRIKEQFVEHEVIPLLCELLVTELEHKRIRNSQQILMEVDAEPIKQMDESVDSSAYDPPAAAMSTDLWELIIEEDIFSLLRALSLFGCSNETIGTRLLDEILVSISQLSVQPQDYIRALQRRVLCDILSFFQDNAFTANISYMSAFESLCFLSFQILKQWWSSTSQKSPSLGFSSSLTAQQTATDWIVENYFPHEIECLQMLFQVLAKPHNGHPLFLSKDNLFQHFTSFLLHVFQVKQQSEDFILFSITYLSEPSIFQRFLPSADFAARFFFYTSSLIAHPNETVVKHICRLWKQIVLARPAYLNQCFISLPSFDMDERFSSEELMFNDKIVTRVTQLEEKERTAKTGHEKEDALRQQRSIKLAKGNEVLRNTKAQVNSVIQLKKESLPAAASPIGHERAILKKWKHAARNITHSRGVWPCEGYRWKLGFTEGTCRMRIRLKPFYDIPIFYVTPLQAKEMQANLMEVLGKSEFLSPETLKYVWEQQKSVLYHYQQHSDDTLEELQQRRRKLDGVVCSRSCSVITSSSKFDGSMRIEERYASFVSADRSPLDSAKPKFTVMKWKSRIVYPYEEVKEIHKRRYLLKNNALEIFLITGRNSLISFDTQADRDAVYEAFLTRELPNRVNYDDEVSGNLLRLSITERWQRGLVSNFEYLIHLNTIAGRSFNDLTQYPVFPFILKDYSSAELDLSNPEIYRDLTKPMGAQDPNRLQKFLERYEMTKKELVDEPPYHYGSHYSNIGSVLHYMVRVEPFTTFFLEFQSGRFDFADRSFHSIFQTWALSSSISSSDVKELIPEFFYLPEFLCNHNRFDFGSKQEGPRVDDVQLPPWAFADPRLFIHRHREALESRYVSENLHHWIDLIFGYKQIGEAAVEAQNVFRHLTYEGAVDVDAIEDDLMRAATIAQINSYGQTPKQLFKKPHPQRTVLEVDAPTLLSQYQALSPSLLWTVSGPVGFIGVANGSIVSLSTKKVLQYPEGVRFIAWGQWDQNLRVCMLETGKVTSVIETVYDDEILCGDMHPSGRVMVTGGSAGVVKVWKKTRNSTKKTIETKLMSLLYGHTDIITCISVSSEFHVVASGSRDKSCILWDLNSTHFVRSLGPHNGSVVAVAICPVNGNVITADDSGDSWGLQVWSINGELLATTATSEKALCVATTGNLTGAWLRNGLIFTGMQSGDIYIWDSTNLQLVYKNETNQLISGDQTGATVSWTLKS